MIAAYQWVMVITVATLTLAAVATAICARISLTPRARRINWTLCAYNAGLLLYWLHKLHVIQG